jgi:hypothetical protein
MLTPADDYPLHQTPEPMAYAGSDRNFYDRFFFNGYSADGSVFFALALGVYPQLNIMDASFSLSYEGRQYNLRCSKEMLGDRLALSIGPLSIEIVKPMHETRITIGDYKGADNQGGLTGELVATARHQPIEEPRFTRRQGTRLMMDLTRATQNIDWHGTLDLRGHKIDITGCRGTRDRSWGIRQVGAADPQAPVPPAPQQFYWLWTPCNFDEAVFFCHTNDDGAGEAWNRKAVFDDFATGRRVALSRIDFTTDYHDGTRRVSALTLEGEGLRASFTPMARLFYMQGLGYIHPEWNHGTHHGSLRVGFDEIELAAAEAALKRGQMENLHVQTLSAVNLEVDGASHKGQGVIEQLFIGPHAPSGFQDLVDRIMT